MNHWSKKWYKVALIGFVGFFVQVFLFVGYFGVDLIPETRFRQLSETNGISMG